MTSLIENRRKELILLRKIRKEKQEGTPAVAEVPPSSEQVVCKKCENIFNREYLKKHLYVCPACGCHMKISSKVRLRQLVDKDTFIEYDSQLSTSDPISFEGYAEKVQALSDKTGRQDAIITGVGEIGGIKAAFAFMDNSFLMGSMGTVVGERFVRICEKAGKENLPLIAVCTSGGARMQEGMFSLLQMAKTSQAIEKFKADGGLYVAVLTNPTTGGVSASFATLGDIIIAEPGALIGFAGPRVIEQTIREKLPEGFQLSEFQMDHGMVDIIADRAELKDVLTDVLKLHQKGELHE